MVLENDTIINDAESLGDGLTLPTEQTESKQTRKTRGPYKKEGAKKPVQTGKKEKLSARQITGILYLGHSAAASAANVPALEITESEAEQLANAIVDVLAHYDFEASAKTVAWANLVGTAATIYGVKLWGALQASREHVV